MPTVEKCLQRVGITTDSLASCNDLAEEWAAIKRSYFKTALKTHPDKGGDAGTFRKVQSAFDALRSLYDGASATFLFSSSSAKAAEEHAAFDASMNTPSWEYYAEAAQEAVPMYRVERAKSSRSRCHVTGDCIEQGELRVGWMNSESGTYGGWVQLKSWRVPNRVWLGLPNPTTCNDVNVFAMALRSMSAVLLSGLGELSGSEMRKVAHLCMNRDNWARKVALKERPLGAVVAGGGGVSARAAVSASALASRAAAAAPPASAPSSSKALVPGAAPSSDSSALGESRVFVIPKPGRDGKPHSLAGKTIVMTGIFPEVGGGTGLSIGKDKVTAMLQSFGARVTSAVSGKTDLLLCGKEPGYAKVSQAQGQGCSLLSLEDVRQGIVRGAIEDIMRQRRRVPMHIENFSAGFRGNGLANRLGVRKAPKELARGYAGNPSPTSRAPIQPRATPTTSSLVAKTMAHVPGERRMAMPAAIAAMAASPHNVASSQKVAEQPKDKAGPEYTAAPLNTIDISQLKPTRFLLPPAALPYRDEVGRISVSMLRDGVVKIENGSIKAPDDVVATLKKWLRHAEKDIAKGGHEWVDNQDGTWSGPGGEVREVIADGGGETDDEMGGEESSEPDDDDDDDDDDGAVAASPSRKRKADELTHGVDEGVLV